MHVLPPDTLIGLGVQPAVVDHVDYVEHVGTEVTLLKLAELDTSGCPADRAFQFVSKLYTTYLGLYSVLVPGLVLGLGLVHLLYIQPGTDFGHGLVLELVHDLHLGLVPHVYAIPCRRCGAFSWWGACSRSPILGP